MEFDKTFNENLLVYLKEINDEYMIETHGKEKLIKTVKNIDIVHSEFKGYRYLYRNEKHEIIACLQGIKDKILCNIYVRPDRRRKGIATNIYKQLLKDMPNTTFADNGRSKSGYLWTCSMKWEK